MVENTSESIGPSHKEQKKPVRKRTLHKIRRIRSPLEKQEKKKGKTKGEQKPAGRNEKTKGVLFIQRGPRNTSRGTGVKEATCKKRVGRMGRVIKWLDCTTGKVTSNISNAKKKKGTWEKKSEPAPQSGFKGRG